MSVRINDKVIAGTYTPQSYRYVGEIFQSILPINDVRVALLDGHKIYDSDGHGGFIQYLNSLVALYPQLACTEDEWQLSNTTYGECGKFVVNEDGSIRLPKIVSFIQGLSSLQDLATLVEAGLPNITGSVTTDTGIRTSTNDYSSSGSFSIQTASQTYTGYTSNAGYDLKSIDFNASLSNPIYGNSTTVQPQSIRYPYYIVLATGVSQELRVKQNLTTNNPFSLLEAKWSDKLLNNISWLRSEGQANSSTVYVDAYNLVLTEYNNSVDETETIGGIEITFRRGATTGMKVTVDKSAYDSILSATGTAWYFVLDTNTASFYLPQTNGFFQFGGNGNFVKAGLPNITGRVDGITTGFGTTNPNGLGVGALTHSTDKQTATGTSGANWITKINLDASKSNAIYGNSNTVQPNAVKGYLYFYVGETVQNANLVNIGRIQETYTTKSMVDGQWVTINELLASNLTISSFSCVYYDISEFLPNDGFDYEVRIQVTGATATDINSVAYIAVGSGEQNNADSGNIVICQTKTQVANNSQLLGGSAIILVKAQNRKIYIAQQVGSNVSSVAVRLINYRRIGTNL